MTGLDEQTIIGRLAQGLDDYHSCPTLLSIHCCGHSAVLSTKSCSSRLDGFPSKLVRLGHQFESGRNTARFNELIDEIIDEQFDFVPVAAMPEGSDGWRLHALNDLKLSRPCLDLSPDEELYIVTVDNSDWHNAALQHFCTGHGCLWRQC